MPLEIHMNGGAILLLFENGKLQGYTKDEPWAKDWCRALRGRSMQPTVRIDRPPGDAETGRVNLQVLEIHFDGGCRPTNPGNRYGSFRVVQGKRVVFQNERIEFGRGTSNEAEFMALTAGLDYALTWVRGQKLDPKNFQLKMVTDSMCVWGRVSGTNTTLKTEPQKRMASYAEKAIAKATNFGHHEITWRGRAHNVAIFGH